MYNLQILDKQIGGLSRSRQQVIMKIMEESAVIPPLTISIAQKQTQNATETKKEVQDKVQQDKQENQGRRGVEEVSGSMCEKDISDRSGTKSPG